MIGRNFSSNILETPNKNTQLVSQKFERQARQAFIPLILHNQSGLPTVYMLCLPPHFPTLPFFSSSTAKVPNSLPTTFSLSEYTSPQLAVLLRLSTNSQRLCGFQLTLTNTTPQGLPDSWTILAFLSQIPALLLLNTSYYEWLRRPVRLSEQSLTREGTLRTSGVSPV